jgi:hypothetical protein
MLDLNQETFALTASSFDSELSDVLQFLKSFEHKTRRRVCRRLRRVVALEVSLSGGDPGMNACLVRRNADDLSGVLYETLPDKGRRRIDNFDRERKQAKAEKN